MSGERSTNEHIPQGRLAPPNLETMTDLKIQKLRNQPLGQKLWVMPRKLDHNLLQQYGPRDFDAGLLGNKSQDERLPSIARKMGRGNFRHFRFEASRHVYFSINIPDGARVLRRNITRQIKLCNI